MKSGVNDLVAYCNRCLSCCHKAHTDVLDNVAGRKGKISHLLGVDLLRLRHNGDISVVNGGVKQSKQAECKSGVDLGILVNGVNEIDLVVCAYVSVVRKLTTITNPSMGKITIDNDGLISEN